MSPGRDARLRGWSVGDRLWAPMTGTGTVWKLRARDQGAPEALVSFSWLADHREWIVLRNVERLGPDQPDRPSEGLQDVEPGQPVWHSRFGNGVVQDLLHGDPGGLSACIVFDADAGQKWIALGSGHLRAQAPPEFDAVFMVGDGSGGDLTLRLTAGLQVANIELSQAFDPIPDLMAWFEALVVEVEQCAFTVDEEGTFKTLQARRLQRVRGSGDQMEFDVWQGPPRGDAASLLNVCLARSSLVNTLYTAMRSFAESDRYTSDAWERYTVGRRVREICLCTPQEWIERSLSLTERELAVAAWPLRPLWSEHARPDEAMTPDEYFRATGKHWDGEGLAPVLAVQVRGWDELQNVDGRRMYLRDLLDRSYRGGGGTPLRGLRSSTIEQWLMRCEDADEAKG